MGQPTRAVRARSEPVCDRGRMSQETRAPTQMIAADTIGGCRSTLGTYPECPLCGADLFPEHAHFKCSGCGWRDSCCD